MDQHPPFSMKSVTLLVLGAVALYWGLNHLELIGDAVGTLIGFLSPFILGCGLAFLLNIPMRAVERGFGRLAAERGCGRFLWWFPSSL